MTIGVYGLVAGIVKLDDLGLWLTETSRGIGKRIGQGILRAAPWLMKTLSVVGTAAMFLVGGGILVHGIAPLHHAVEGFSASYGGALTSTLANGVLGVVAGALVLALVSVVGKAYQAVRG